MIAPRPRCGGVEKKTLNDWLFPLFLQLEHLTIILFIMGLQTIENVRKNVA